MTDRPKTCKSCVHVKQPPPMSMRGPQCTRRVVFDKVFGEMNVSRDAYVERSRLMGWLGGCGPEAKFFKQRKEPVITTPKIGKVTDDPND